MQSGEYANAVEEFKKVLSLDPTLVEAEVNLGLAYQSLAEYGLALSHLGKALRQRPNLIGPTVIVGIDYLKLGSPDEAMPFLQQALKLDPMNRDAREALASYYLSQENFQSAAEQYRALAVSEPDKPEAWFKLGHQYLDLAARLAYRGAHLYRDSVWGHRFLGDVLSQRGRWDDAQKQYEKAVAIDPKLAGLHASLGQTYIHLQRLAEAESEFNQEIQLDQHDELALLGLANVQLLKNQPRAALDSLGKIWDASPEFLTLQRDFPAIELPVATAADVVAGLQALPDSPVKRFLLASISKRESPGNQSEPGIVRASGDPCKAHHLASCVEWLQARKRPTAAEHLLLGKTYFALQQYDLAASALSQAQGATKDDAEASYWLARTYEAQGTEAYSQLLESSPDSWRACELRAEASSRRGDTSDAVKEYQAALALRPNEPELHEMLGELYLDHHQEDAAQGELERVLSLDASRTHAMYLLGRLFVLKRDNEKALPYLERAVHLEPDLIEANSLLGTAYLRLGQYAKAVPKLEKAAPSDHYGSVHYQLSTAYRKLGKAELAKKELGISQDLHRSYLEHDLALIMGSIQPESEQQ